VKFLDEPDNRTAFFAKLTGTTWELDVHARRQSRLHGLLETKMPKKKRRSKTQPSYTFLAICVERYEVETEATVNHYLEQPQYAFRELRDDDPVFEYTTRVKIRGTSTYPDERAGEAYEVILRGDDAPSTDVHLKLSDVHERDEYRSPRYRSYRGREIPVFKTVPGFGVLNKNGREWNAWLTVAPRLVSDMLTLLGTGRKLYLSLDERKEQRLRWIRGLALRSTDPAEE
jgi:hypothetical protein